MIRAAFVTQHESWPWKRQLPAGEDTVQGVQFFVPVEQADVVFVYDALPTSRLAVPARAMRVFISSEPENVKRYNAAFLAQFDVVITSDRQTPHPNRVFVQAGLPWHAGSMTDGGKLLQEPMRFEEFERHDPVKTRLVSVVSSDKAFTEAHRARLAFVAKLKEALGDQVDVFGRGIADFADKRDVLDSYRYHIALENCSIADYWTEKIADPYLTLTFPIYHGCPNIQDYFPEEALQPINIYEPDGAVEIIRKVIGSDLAEQRREHLLEARRRVMHEHNVFMLLAHTAKAHGNAPARAERQGQVTLRYEESFSPVAGRFRSRVTETLASVPYLRAAVRAVKSRLHR
ncbi:glycosyltransferase family 10 domain-containing protein [Pannonibacter indicus]|uniref:glycosyltransferase family 10 domain-containing protein n=1 Tax=Pannonibacter indicus TaxID=466044 RepID=UPI00391D9DE2